ncbi:MAG: putative tetratricopeptide [Herminiimonas sp.]|nr:putative tetratricopeptide [Herminiimonas sp.]MDB5854573.1 putative tetratricopeptide [Herminiimonas sp.]
MPIPPPPPTPSARLDRLLEYLKQDPDNPRLRADIFDTALTEGRLATAQEQALAMLEKTPQDAPWRHRLALVRIAQTEYPEARRILAQLIDEGFTDPVITLNLAHAAFRDGDFTTAEQTLRQMPESVDESGPAFVLLLRCLHRLGAVSDALALFQSRLATGGVSSDAFGVASLLAFDAGLIAEAGVWSEAALADDPLHYEALVAQGSALLASRDADAAALVLDRALTVNPVDGRTWSARATASMLQMDLGEAQRQYEKAVAYMPTHIGTWHGLAWCRLMLKDFAGARRAFESALELDRNFGESHGGLAVALAMEGRAAEAREAIERANRLDPSNLSARYAQAVLSGDATDVARFEGLARRLLAGRIMGGKSMADLILERRS